PPGAAPRAPRRAAQQGRAGELEQPPGGLLGVGLAQQASDAVLEQQKRPAPGDRDHRKSAGLRLEHDLAEGVGGAREQEDVGVRVGPRQSVALEPAEEDGAVAEALAQMVLLGPATRQHELQAWLARAGEQEGLGKQLDALLARDPPGVED